MNNKVPSHYVPKFLTKTNRDKQKKELLKSRKLYKKGKYYTRSKIKGFKNKKSPWEKRVRDTYGIKDNNPIHINKLASISGCSKKSLNKIVKKGMGAYYSSGSRPNQTPHSWGYARLYSSMSGGPASSIDINILKEGCPKYGKTLKLAINARKNSKRSRVSLVKK